MSLPATPEPSDTPIVVRIISERSDFYSSDLANRLPGSTLDQGDVVFTVDAAMPADVVVVMNYLRYDQDIESRRGFVWKWDNEPIVRTPFAKGLDRIFTHVKGSPDSRVTVAPPVLDWWVGKSYDELFQTETPEKTKTISAIASTKTLIDGHRRREEFVTFVSAEVPELDVFGQGRERELSDKWDGLAPYRYSIAIENTSSDDYWTEKIADCFLSYTVPLYFGAPNITEYFPEGSLIWLPMDDRERALRVIHDTLRSDDWVARLPALTEARRLVLERYSLGAQITRLVRENRDAILTAPRVTTRVQGRRTKPGGWIRGLGLVGNVKARVERRRVRLERNG